MRVESTLPHILTQENRAQRPRGSVPARDDSLRVCGNPYPHTTLALSSLVYPMALAHSFS